MKKWIILLNILLVAEVRAQLNMVPMPAEQNRFVKAAPFKLGSKTVIYYNNVLLENDIALFKQLLKEEYGLVLKSVYMPELAKKGVSNDAGAIAVTMGPRGWESGHGKEFYNIYATGSAMNIMVQQPEGFFRSVQTLRQLVEQTGSVTNRSYKIPAVSFSDYPRFAYRGMHLDVGRHFFRLRM
jgi:hexosaminidase